MAQRTKKKRNKAYQGQDAAAPDRPVVHRYKAVQRSKIGQWWHDKKKFLRPLLITILVVAVIIWLLIELFRIIL